MKTRGIVMRQGCLIVVAQAKATSETATETATEVDRSPQGASGAIMDRSFDRSRRDHPRLVFALEILDGWEVEGLAHQPADARPAIIRKGGLRFKRTMILS
jgi:hypothetical protein